MTELVSGLRGRWRLSQPNSDSRRSEGSQFEDAVLRHAWEIPGWEIAKSWRYEAEAVFYRYLLFRRMRLASTLVPVTRNGLGVAAHAPLRFVLPRMGVS